MNTLNKKTKNSFVLNERYNHFKLIRENFIKDDFVEKDLTFNMFCSNVLSILISIPLLIFFIYYFLQYFGQKRFLPFEEKILEYIPFKINVLLFFTIFLIFVFVHELIHGLCWSCFLKNHFLDINFGISWKHLTPYCSTKQPLKKYQYILGAVMPTIILGIIPFLLSLKLNSIFLYFFSIGMILGGIGDCLVSTKVLIHKTKSKNSLYLDHPGKCGCVVFYKI